MTFFTGLKRYPRLTSYLFVPHLSRVPSKLRVETESRRETTTTTKTMMVLHKNLRCLFVPIAAGVLLSKQADAFGVPVPSRLSLHPTRPTRSCLGDTCFVQPLLLVLANQQNARRTTRTQSSTLLLVTKNSMLFDFPRSILHNVLSTLSGPLLFLIRELRGMTTPQKVVLLCLCVISFALGRTKPFWKRYECVLDIPKHYFGPTAPILRGRAVSVSDGDTIRFLHTPTRLHPTDIRKEKKEKASEHALPIRICTIDTPETAKFGKPGQPFGKEAKEQLTTLLENKRIHVRLLQADQYGRGVGQVFVRGLWPWQRIFADEHMLKAGLAEVYQGGGAVYGRLGKDSYLEMEDEARRQKVGIWSIGQRESAAEYKKRTK